MKLSIIIPYHKTYELTLKLLDVLTPQLTDETEVIIINDCDDTRFDKVKMLYCESNGTASKPRNIGLDNAIGEYIAFIDSDDLVSENYIEKIMEKINTSEFDHCYISWKFNGLQKGDVIIADKPSAWNCSSWNCIIKKETIGNERFDENLKVGEDYDFNLRVRKGKQENILDVLYYYNDNRKDSLMWEALQKG